jgi:hypothetical protein
MLRYPAAIHPRAVCKYIAKNNEKKPHRIKRSSLRISASAVWILGPPYRSGDLYLFRLIKTVLHHWASNISWILLFWERHFLRKKRAVKGCSQESNKRKARKEERKKGEKSKEEKGEKERKNG